MAENRSKSQSPYERAIEKKLSEFNSLHFKSQEMIGNREIGGDATRFAILQKLEMKISFQETKLNKALTKWKSSSSLVLIGSY